MRHATPFPSAHTTPFVPFCIHTCTQTSGVRNRARRVSLLLVASVNGCSFTVDGVHALRDTPLSGRFRVSRNRVSFPLCNPRWLPAFARSFASIDGIWYRSILANRSCRPVCRKRSLHSRWYYRVAWDRPRYVESRSCTPRHAHRDDRSRLTLFARKHANNLSFSHGEKIPRLAEQERASGRENRRTIYESSHHRTQNLIDDIP